MRTTMIHAVQFADRQQDGQIEDDLIARLCDHLDRAERVVRALGSADGGSSDCEQSVASTDQIVTETAVFLLAASNVASYAAIGPRVIQIATLLLPHVHSRQVLRRICLEPARAFEQATAHICLKRLGFYDCDFDAMLDLAAASHAAGGWERTPSGMIEHEWLKQGWLYPEGMRRLRCGGHIANSPLGRPIDLLHGSREDVRSVTRSIMHMMDFNIFPRSLPRSREILLAEAEALLARVLDAEEYDLAAEVLLAWPLTGETWSPAAAFAFRVLVRAEDAKREADAHQDGAAPAAASYGFGLLCAASLMDRCLPPHRLPEGNTVAGAYDAALDCLDLGARQALWQDELNELSEDERESLAGFLMSVALHREFQQRNFDAMQRLLGVSNALGLMNTPLACQAIELVKRVDQFAESFFSDSYRSEFDSPAHDARDAAQKDDASVCA